MDRVTDWELSEESKSHARLWRYSATPATDLEATYVDTRLRAERIARGGWQQHDTPIWFGRPSEPKLARARTGLSALGWAEDVTKDQVSPKMLMRR